MKDVKFIVFLIILIVICLSPLGIRYLNNNLEPVYNYNSIIDVSEGASDDYKEEILLSWYKQPQKFYDTGEVEIVFLSNIKGELVDKDVNYIFQCRKDNNYASEDDITVLYKNKKLPMQSGKCTIAKEIEGKREKKYSFQVLFKNEGEYEIELFADMT